MNENEKRVDSQLVDRARPRRLTALEWTTALSSRRETTMALAVPCRKWKQGRELTAKTGADRAGGPCITFLRLPVTHNFVRSAARSRLVRVIQCILPPCVASQMMYPSHALCLCIAL